MNLNGGAGLKNGSTDFRSVRVEYPDITKFQALSKDLEIKVGWVVHFQLEENVEIQQGKDNSTAAI